MKECGIIPWSKGHIRMSIATAAFIIAAYLAVRPFANVRFPKKDVEDDLRDYYRWVCAQRSPLKAIMLVLDESGVSDRELRDRLSEACEKIRGIKTWDDVALADRLVVQAMDDAIAVLDDIQQGERDHLYRDAKTSFNTTDEKLIGVRRMLDRDIPKLNGSFVHRFGFLARWLKIPTYPILEPIQWYPERAPRDPRWMVAYIN
jgi:hypothetical protein